MFLVRDQQYKNNNVWVPGRHRFCNSATFKYMLLTVRSPRRVAAPHVNHILTAPTENYLKKRHNPDVPSLDQLHLSLDVQKGLDISRVSRMQHVTWSIF